MRASGHATFHGFGIAQAMREQRGSRSLTAHGTLYKALGRLEEFGLLTSRWEDAAAAEGRPRRRLYELTGAGGPGGRARPSPTRPSGAPAFPSHRRGARMTPERMAGLVMRWVRLYTRGLPAPIADAASTRSTPTSTTTSPTSGPPGPATGGSRSASPRGWPAASPPTSHGAAAPRTAPRSSIGIVRGALSALLCCPWRRCCSPMESAWGPADFVSPACSWSAPASL